MITNVGRTNTAAPATNKMKPSPSDTAVASGPAVEESALDELRARIVQAIKPHVDPEAKPPFDEQQLVAMAMIMRGVALTIREACDWAIDNFRYHHNLARLNLSIKVADWNPSFEQRYDGTPKLDDFCYRMHDVFDSRSFEAPLVYEGVREGVRKGTCEGIYSITRSHAEWLLRHACPVDTVVGKAFPFFKLPAELRNTIYGMVFQLPKSGVLLKRQRRQTKVEVLSRAYDQDFNPDTFPKGYDTTLKLGTLSKILSPLLVCQQLYSEAVPFFYRINYFHFKTVHDFREIMSFASSKRLQYYGHISFGYAYADDIYGGNAFKSLRKMTSLRRIDIRVDEEDWKERVHNARSGSYRSKLGGKGVEYYTPIEETPRFKPLGRLMADEVHFHGPCPSLEAALKTKMTRPRQVVAAVSVTRKRKIEGEDASKAKKQKKA